MASKYSTTICFMVLYAAVLHGGFACLPYYGAFNRGYAGNYDYGNVIMPLHRSEAHSHDSHDHHHPPGGEFRASAMHDEASPLASLNCPTFATKCKWANTNDEELDWTTLQAVPNPDRFLSLVDGEDYPDPAAGVLTSPQRPGWEGGQLISDPLPCLPYGIRVTATAWKTQNGPLNEQPKLQVCSKNVVEVRFPLVNCNEFEVRNGVPVSVDVPAANSPSQPAHIVFYGNNFVSPQGGAIFLQDIVVEGTLTCGGEQNPSDHPKLIDEAEVFRKQPSGDDDLQQLAAAYSKTYDPVAPLKVMEGLSSLEALVDGTPEKMSNKILNPLTSMSGNPYDKASIVQSISAERSQQMPFTTSTLSPPAMMLSPALFESCLELSCNPSDLSCSFWRSSGNTRWEIGSAGRLSNPLTGINQLPETGQKFLVAPFMDPNTKSYTLVSEALTVPLMETVYFCFYEYFATQGFVLSICTDRMDCFYKKDALMTGNTIDLRVIAENNGDNKGEIGFLPIRLARDPAGQQMIC
uniref:MAM domain-containing protein n=1 Tax=Haemonchus contortus TaxID=6289 RepID=A0A7I4XWF5_HAECO